MNQIHELAAFFQRDLQKLKEEISLYPNEQDIWKITGDVKNSAGNLTLHLCGNLKHFVGALLGQTGYVRQRDLEFSIKDISKNELMNMIDDTVVVVASTFSALDDTIIDENFPVEKHGQTVTTGHMLLHLMSHLAYHLGQVNYHRRMIK